MNTIEEPVVNRLSGYFATVPCELPKTDHERHATYTDAVMETIITLRAFLSCGNVKVVLKVAEMILALERTRMRHSRNVVGCTPPLQQLDLDELNGREPRNTSAQQTQTFASQPAELNEIWDDDDDDDDPFMMEAAAPPKPACEYAKTEEEALAWHNAETKEQMNRMRGVQPELGLPCFNEAKAAKYVKKLLRDWNVKAIEIPKGTFFRHGVRWMRENTAAQAEPSSN